MTGIFGKLPAHGDFVQRSLPVGFVAPWDQWLQASVEAARAALATNFDAVWATAPAWRFRLPPGICGEDAVAGLLLPSRDRVGRHFPITLAAVLSGSAKAPSRAWYASLEAAGRAALERGERVDEVLAALPDVVSSDATVLDCEAPPEGWWMDVGHHGTLTTLPTTSQFLSLLQGGAHATRLVSGAGSHRGTMRERNEDAFLDRADIGLWAVADGAGGHGSGDVASAAIVAALADLPPSLSAAELLAQVRLRTAAVHRTLQQQAAAMGTGNVHLGVAAHRANDAGTQSLGPLRQQQPDSTCRRMHENRITRLHHKGCTQQIAHSHALQHHACSSFI